MKQLALCLLLTGCVTPPDTMTVIDPQGKALATVDFQKQQIQLTKDAMSLLVPRPMPVVVPMPIPTPRRR